MSGNETGQKRTVQYHFLANKEEDALIKQRMATAGITGMGAYLRKMAIDGYHVNIDLSDVREMVSLLRRCSNNINQIAKRTNETRNIYAADVEALRRQYDSLWEAANKILIGLAKIG